MCSSSVAAIAFLAVAAQARDADSHGSVVLLQTHVEKTETEWDVKSWFNRLTHGDSADKEDAEDVGQIKNHNKDAVAHKAVANGTASSVVNGTSGACEDWCADEKYTKVEAGVEVVKNFSSWTMKCSWKRCKGCAQCGNEASNVQKNESDAQGASQLSLSQGLAELDESMGFGDKVPITEKGYKVIADLKDDVQMTKFIKRVAASEARYIKDLGPLAGLVPFYSGTAAVQSLDALRKELRSVPWVLETEGRRAPLSEFGYEKIASMMSKPDMVAFARRLLDADRKIVTDEAAFQDVVSHYNGQTGRNIEQLRNELNNAPWVQSKDAPAEDVSMNAHENAKTGKGRNGKGRDGRRRRV